MARARTVNFSNTVIIMTSNVGSNDLQTAKIGFSLTHDGRDQNQAIRTRLMAELSRTFRPEFLNRIDDIIVFNSLAREHLGKIVELQLGYLLKLLEEKKIRIEVTESAKDLLLTDGYDEKFGARPLKRSIQRLIQDPLALAILNGDFGEDDVVIVDRDSEKAALCFKKKIAVAA